jgi:uncharacterized protein DUF2442
MAELTRAQIDAGNAHGREIVATLPHAATARYDRRSRRIIVELTNGSLFAFPAELAQGLAGASADQLSEIELSGAGYGLHWPQLDADLTVPGLLAGVFGTARWMAAQAGRASSPAKAAAARRNGIKGGRPRKAVA